MALRDPGLAVGLTRLKRPGLLVVAFRWRHEIWITTVLLAWLTLVISWVGITWTLAALGGLAVLVGLAATLPEVRRSVTARAWAIITPHRVRTCFAQAWVNNRTGQIPAVLRAKAEPFGERVLVWCRAGTSFEDIASACDLLAATCWATEVIASRSHRYAHVVYLNVIRREQRMAGTGAKPEFPPLPRPDEEPERPRLFGLPTNDWHDAA
jgi:hypothetical protein